MEESGESMQGKPRHHELRRHWSILPNPSTFLTSLCSSPNPHVILVDLCKSLWLKQFFLHFNLPMYHLDRNPHSVFFHKLSVGTHKLLGHRPECLWQGLLTKRTNLKCPVSSFTALNAITIQIRTSADCAYSQSINWLEVCKTWNIDRLTLFRVKNLNN